MNPIDEVLRLCRNARQKRVSRWALDVFGLIALDRAERIDRFLEEALELAQAAGVTKERVLGFVEYVYGRPKGHFVQEVGGVSLTLLVLCESYGLSTDEAEYDEMERVLQVNPERLRAKQNAKALAGTGRAIV